MASHTDRQWFTRIEPQSIGATTHRNDGSTMTRASTASVSRIGNIWWVDRVKVDKRDRQRGIGRTLIGMLKVSLVDNHGSDLVVRVCPGGYDTGPDVQRDFYLSCGFRIVKNYPELTMEWAPCRPGNTKSSEDITPSRSPASSTENGTSSPTR